MANVKAIIITVGDELLSGQTIDTNSSWLAERLGDFGISTIRRVSVGDDRQEILNSLNEEIPRAELIIITGGLGPTSDDITKPLLREYFGGKMVVDHEVLEHIKNIFEKRKLPLPEKIISQAEVPDSCKTLFNRQGTAPGMLFERQGKIIISLPGVPYEMMSIFEDTIVPLIRRRLLSDAIIHRTVITAGLGESFIAEKIRDIEAALPPHIHLAYLPGYWMVKLRLTAKGPDKIRLNKELDLFQGEIAEKLGEIVISLEDLPPEQILGKLLSVKEKTLGLAESCSGGYIAHKITQIMGSAKYFNGSIVCYQYEVKNKLLHVDNHLLEKKGAVCEEVALQMADGARKTLNSDYGFGITGLLSPGGDDDKTPVGTVWMAVCNENQKESKVFHFPYDRLRNKEVAVNMAFLMLIKFIQKS